MHSDEFAAALTKRHVLLSPSHLAAEWGTPGAWPKLQQLALDGNDLGLASPGPIPDTWLSTSPRALPSLLTLALYPGNTHVSCHSLLAVAQPSLRPFVAPFHTCSLPELPRALPEPAARGLCFIACKPVCIQLLPPEPTK